MGNRKIGNKYKGVKVASKSSVEIAFTYNGVRCRERVACKPTDANIRKLAVFRDEILASIENGSFDYEATFPNSNNSIIKKNRPYTVKDGLIDWLNCRTNNLKASTLCSYNKIIENQLLPTFGNMPIENLTLYDIKLFIINKASHEKVTATTISNIISPLRCALEYAEEFKRIKSSPMRGWKVNYNYFTVKKSQKGKTIKPFTFEERSAILDALTGQNKNLVRFIMWTGLRTSEFIALNWNDVNWKTKTLTIDKALTEAADLPEETKTDAGERTIKLLPEALKALQDQKKYTWQKGEEIFQNPQKNERWTGDQAVRKSMWKPALKKADVEYRYPYQTRHTFASMMLTDGEQIHWLSKQMGHTDWSFTARTYAKYIEDDDNNAGSKAVEAHNKRVKAATKRKSRHDSEPDGP